MGEARARAAPPPPARRPRGRRQRPGGSRGFGARGDGIVPPGTDATHTASSTPRLITLRVNGRTWEGAVRPHELLLDVLRGPLGLTGTKRGCDMGTCGCCAVQIDGEPRLACLMLALDCGCLAAYRPDMV